MTLHTTLSVDGVQVQRTGTGNGPIAALLDILGQDGVDVRVLDFSEHALSEGGNARAAAYVECAVGERVLWGIGIDPNTSMSSLKAVISAVNRAVRDAQEA
jgi:2-isopropylmalate synthase